MTEAPGTPVRDAIPPGSRTRPGLVALAWLLGNLAIGYLAIMPLAVVDHLSYYVRAVHFHDDVVAPYGPVGAKFAVAEIIFWTAVLVTASVLHNRRQWRRFRATRTHPPRRAGVASTAMAVGVAVLQLLPSVIFLAATDRTFPPLAPGAWH